MIGGWLLSAQSGGMAIGLQESIESDVVCRQQHDAEHDDDTDEDSYFFDSALHYLSLPRGTFRELG